MIRLTQFTQHVAAPQQVGQTDTTLLQDVELYVAFVWLGLDITIPFLFIPTVGDKNPWKSTRLHRSESFAAYSPLSMFFACEVLSPFAKTTLWEGKVSQSVSTILSEAVALKKSLELCILPNRIFWSLQVKTTWF